MVKKETYIFTLILSALIILAFSLLYFLIPFPIKDRNCYITCYSLTLIGAIILVVSFFLGYGKRNSIEGLVFRLPLVNLVTIFEIINVILCVIQLTINCFVPIPFYVPIIVSLFEIVIYFILYLLKKQNINHIEHTDDFIKDKTKTIKDLRIKSINILSLCKDDVSKNNISIIVEKLKYSDPVSNESIRDIETQILLNLDKIEEDLKDGKVIDSISDILTLIENRNTACKGSK